MKAGNDSFGLEHSGSRLYKGGRPELNLKNSWTINEDEAEGEYFM